MKSGYVVSHWQVNDHALGRLEYSTCLTQEVDDITFGTVPITSASVLLHFKDIVLCCFIQLFRCCVHVSAASLP